MSRDRALFGLLVTWAALLALGLVFACLPLPAQMRWIFGLSIALAALAAIGIQWIWTRRHASGAASAIPAGLDPAMPVILWHAAGAAGWKPATPRHDGHALWLHAQNSEQAMALADDVVRWRGRPPEAALLAVAPGLLRDRASLHGDVAGWRYALQLLARRHGRIGSAWLAVHAPAGTGGQAAVAPVWHGVLRHPDQPARPADAVLNEAVARLDPAVGSSSMGKDVAGALRAQAALRWAQMQLLPALADLSRSLPPMRLNGVLAGELPGQMAGSLHEHWVMDQTGLRPAVQAPGASWPLPAPLVPLLVQPAGPGRWFRALLIGVILAALALAIALAASFVQNHRLLQHLNDDLIAWQALPDSATAERAAAVVHLRTERDRLLGFARDGVPLRLGWGLYRADRLLLPIDQAIASWHPPAPPAPPPPAVISLDSLSLFDSGSARLKPDAGRSLVEALMAITAHPDKRALIAGHTDNTGNAAANQALSEARAAAVRDWFVAMSRLPATHFGIQGYGDSRPLVPNDSDEHKARNRRVEITLLPDEPAH